MSNLLEFESFPKIDRYTNETATITEKIDGTNACISISPGTDDGPGDVIVQSRNRIITWDNDNAGFATWVAQNQAELVELLGPGRHFGEWWGVGIQRRYGLESRRFSLFNTHRWAKGDGLNREIGVANRLPVFVTHVPVLATTTLDHLANTLADTHGYLRLFGSQAAPGFMDPEGCMIYLHRLGRYLKAPLDATPKWAAEKAAA